VNARERLGRVGVWWGALGLEPAAVERDAAAAVEALGYGALWYSETPVNKEAFAHAAILLGATQRIVVASGIANIYARDPAAAVNGAGALGEAFGDRFLLGIGVSHAPSVAMRGHDYGKPLTAMRAYLDAMDAATPRFPIAGGGEVPRVLAALRPRMLELARDRSAGAHPYFAPVEHTARAREVLGAGPLLAPEQAFVLETDPEKAREAARDHMKTYLRLPNYANNLRELGFGDDDFADGGSDRLVDAIVVWGEVDAVAERVRAHHEAGADHVCVQPLGASVDESRAWLRELAPAVVQD
jgi:probable F420-dependent oxidoreductase